MSKPMRQRTIGDRETVTVGAKLDSSLHAIIKDTALKRSVSMSMIVEEAIRYYIENELEIDLKESV